MKTGSTPDEAWIFDMGGGLGGEWPLSIVLDDQGRIDMKFVCRHSDRKWVRDGKTTSNKTFENRTLCKERWGVKPSISLTTDRTPSGSKL